MNGPSLLWTWIGSQHCTAECIHDSATLQRRLARVAQSRLLQPFPRSAVASQGKQSRRCLTSTDLPAAEREPQRRNRLGLSPANSIQSPPPCWFVSGFFRQAPAAWLRSLASVTRARPVREAPGPVESTLNLGCLKITLRLLCKQGDPLTVKTQPRT